MNSSRPKPPEVFARDLVKMHGAKYAYSMTLTFPTSKYFQRVGKSIVKQYPKEMTASEPK